MQGADSGIDESIIQYLAVDQTHPHLWKNQLDGRYFIKFADRYFHTRPHEDNFTYTVYNKCNSSILSCQKSIFSKCIDVIYSQSDHMFYPATEIGRLQALSGYSYPVAKLHVFCRQIPYDLLTYEEKSTLMGFSRVDYDAINDFLRDGMPSDYLTPALRESIHHSVITIDNSLSKLPAYQEIVYRGATLPTALFEKVKVNDLFHSVIFASSSADETIAQKFTLAPPANRIGVTFEIKLHTSGRPIMLYALHAYEAEVLIQRNSWFSVKKIEDTKIFLTEIAADGGMAAQALSARAICCNAFSPTYSRAFCTPI